ncbi:helicase C-terminal domain-containing protein [Trujillonella endophytica]|uniref:Helicase conserved C-terminal domain-containing protein n=1 Tax=Trujillonella endophytica TaxID=673521 RepID=A0A1H8V2N1_9ACTN|nr:helicase C-terminal domain-containing protein [Trujillella endophytica]SEP09646.1 Helicase conserved C-terminal domain-containing protein [Trujillella endophytica]
MSAEDTAGAAPADGRPATLAGWLRTRTDAQVAALLAARPDVARPAPTDVVALASRLAVPVSVDRALDELDAATLQVLDVVLLAPTDGVDAADLFGALPEVPEQVLEGALEALTTRALLWGEDLLHAPEPVRRAVRYPAGLGRRAAELRLTLPADLPAALGELPADEREVLERLAGSRPVGHLPDTSGGPGTAARRLLQRGLLARIDALNVELPREVALLLRGSRPYGPPRLRPEPEVSTRDTTTLDRRAAGAALEIVGRIGELLTLLEEEPAGLLRSGGVAVRDQKRVARTLHVDETDAGWLLELALAAGLLDVGGPHRDEWLPTRAYDLWREQDLADRWATLAAGWLDSSRLPSLVGQRDVGGKAVNALSPDLVRHTAAGIRRGALAALAEYPRGAGLAPDALVELLRWRTPRRADRLAPVPGMLDEAARLGVLVGGVLTTGGRGLLTGGEDGAADGMRGLLPAPVDHVLAQPDLSLIAPGPLVAELADTLAVVADVESSGGATVFRVSEASVRRALDSGWSATDLHEFFTRASRTPVPQALDYLVDDVARQHGRVRVGSIESYVRSDDHGLLSQVLNDRRTASAELRRLAPGVLVSGLGADEVLTVLREAGYAPAGESAGGAVLTRPPARPRALGRKTTTTTTAAPRPLTEAELAATVREIRAGDAALSARRTEAVRQIPGVTTAGTLELLSRAVRVGLPVWLGYVDAQGSGSQRIVQPVSLGGGFLQAFDEGRGETRTFAVHRITSVALVDDEAPPPA